MGQMMSVKMDNVKKCSLYMTDLNMQGTLHLNTGPSNHCK